MWKGVCMPEDCMSTNTLDQEDIRRRVQAYIVDDLIQRGFLPAEKRSPVPVLTSRGGTRAMEFTQGLFRLPLEFLEEQLNEIESLTLLSEDRKSISLSALEKIADPLILTTMAYRDLLNRIPSKPEYRHYAELAWKGVSGREIVYGIASSQEAQNIHGKLDLSNLRGSRWRRILAKGVPAFGLLHALQCRAIAELTEVSVRVQEFTKSDPKTDSFARATIPPSEDLRSSLRRSLLEEIDKRYRGSDKGLCEQMKFYIRYLRPVHTLGPMLDIGCGRGILLEIMREQQFDAIGIDANKDQVAICASKGLNVQLDDGYEFLKRIPSGALSAVTLIHVIEHLQLDDLLVLLREARRAIADGGVVILETPNPENLFVSSYHFHIDPTHVRPLPFELISTILSTVGLSAERLPLETRLHEELGHPTGNIHLDYLLERPANLAILGRKQ